MPRPRLRLRFAVVAVAVLAGVGGCTRAPVTTRPEAGLTITAPDREAAHVVALVLTAYAQPWLADLLPHPGPPAWTVVMDAQVPHPGYDPASGRIALLPRTITFPRDLLHAATQAWCERTCGGGAGLAGMPWYARLGLPLVAEGLAGQVWQDHGEEEARRAVMQDRILHDHLELGVPVDRLGPLLTAIRAGHPPVFATLLPSPPADPDAAAAAGWAICSFLLQADARTRTALVRACGDATHAPEPLTSRIDPALLEDRWQRFLHRLAFATPGA